MTKISLIISLNMKYKNQDKNMMCARCKLNYFYIKMKIIKRTYGARLYSKLVLNTLKLT